MDWSTMVPQRQPPEDRDSEEEEAICWTAARAVSSLQLPSNSKMRRAGECTPSGATSPASSTGPRETASVLWPAQRKLGENCELLLKLSRRGAPLKLDKPELPQVSVDWQSSEDPDDPGEQPVLTAAALPREWCPPSWKALLAAPGPPESALDGVMLGDAKDKAPA